MSDSDSDNMTERESSMRCAMRFSARIRSVSLAEEVMRMSDDEFKHATKSKRLLRSWILKHSETALEYEKDSI